MPAHGYLKHHGILGQKWGVKNGPPYPLGGGDYTPSEKKAIKKARKKKYSRYNKKHYDEVLKEGTTFRTLSYDKNRTKDVDMFFASHTNVDVDHYQSFFNKKAPQTLYDKDGNEIGTGMFYKYSIRNKAVRDVKIASEDSGIRAFAKLYSTDRDFYNYVTDPTRLRADFESGVHRISPGYMKARKVMDKMADRSYKPTEDDLGTVYRIYNHSIPAYGGEPSRKAKDVAIQRAKFFNELKNEGYSGVLDTNDALYNTVQAQSPVIIFDMSSIALQGAERSTMSEVYRSKAINYGRHLTGRL